MNTLINNIDGKLTTTSKVISEAFNKTHRDVLRAISSLDCSDEFSRCNFAQSEYLTERGKTYQCYNITEEGFYFLCMGFTGKPAAKWKEMFIAEFKRMRLGTLSIDSRMIEISKKLEAVKADGKLWSQLGHQIRKNKNIACIESEKLLNEVQLKLEY